jgi:DNA helicase-2/ATP-dependent DNA helicase PcrA
LARTYNQPSRFLREIPAELIHEIRPKTKVSQPHSSLPTGLGQQQESGGWSLGQRVTHKTFGEGVIMDCEGQGAHARVQVNFEQAGTKWLVLAYAGLDVAG